MKKLLLVLSLLLFSSPVQAQVQLGLGVAEFSLNASAGGGGTNGTTFNMPSSATMVSWQVSFSSAPASDTILLQGSFDNSTFFTLDTSTATAGEIRNWATTAPFIRCNINAKSGGGTTTCTVMTKAGIYFGQFPTLGFANGSCTAPSMYFGNEVTLGWAKTGTATICLGSGGALTPVMQLGGTDNTFPAIRRNGTIAEVVLADASAYGGVGTQFINMHTPSGGSAGTIATTSAKLYQFNDASNATGIEINGGLASLGTCTGGALVAGSHNHAGRVTGTTGGTCAINFGTPNYTNAPFCFAIDETAGGVVNTSGESTSTFTISNITSGHAVKYWCVGRIGTT